MTLPDRGAKRLRFDKLPVHAVYLHDLVLFNPLVEAPQSHGKESQLMSYNFIIVMI
jgi:hypothetical protein